MILAAHHRKWIKKGILIVFLIEIAYLVIINAALRLPLTQTLVNQIRPDKFNVSWEQAWSWYPFRVHATGVAANGQSRSQQWQVETASASASIALLPLILKRVWVSNVDVVDINYRQRPRLKPGRDYSDLLPYFPDIAGREVAEAITTPRKKKRPWHIALDNVTATGSHHIWVYQASGSAEGEITTDLTFQTRGGPFSLDADHVDLTLGALYLNGEREVFKRGRLRGELGFVPFVPRENKGAAMLEFLKVDTELEFDLNSLKFINLFMLNFPGASVDGKGRVEGRLRYDQGDVLSGTDLSVDAQNLKVGMSSHWITGNGAVRLALGPDTDELLDLAFHYRDLQVMHEDSTAAMLTGQGLLVNIGGNGRVLVDPERPNPSRTLAFTIDGLEVPDLGLLERYLPEKWPMDLYGGGGELQGVAKLSPTSLFVDLALTSAGADMGVKDYRFFTNLDVALKLDNPSLNSQRTKVGGTYIKLSDARLTRDASDRAATWDASLVINAGDLSLSGENKQADDLAGDLLLRMSKTRGRQWMSNAYGHLEFEADVSSLAWIGLFFGDDYNVGLAGAGSVDGVLNVVEGWPAAGTEVTVASPELAVNVLDYQSNGDGKISLRVEAGDSKPNWFIEVALADADFKRADEVDANIHEVELNLAAVLSNVDFEKKVKPDSLDFKILSAKVSDMSTFNAYMPTGGSLAFTRGTAELTADILLQRDDADGWVRLNSEGLEADVGEQLVSGDLAVEVLLVNGVPRDMMFDISGSQLRLDNVRVVGEDEQFQGDYWSAVFNLLKSRATWTKPPILDIEAELLMSDTRPIVTMFENQGKRPEFLSRILTVEDVQGTASLKVADEELRIINAHAISDKIEIGAKGTLSKTDRDAVIYFRYKKADGLMKFKGDKKNLDIIGVREKYDEYRLTP